MTARLASSGRRPATRLSRFNQQPVTVLVDTREQEPYSFDARLVVTERRTLPAGDYSVACLEGVVGVERKTLDDFVSTVIHSRRRFREELKRLAEYRVGVWLSRGASSTS
jgi:ERCC4-type nuclease